jgi:cob(II)yrinic acid a,c-diamide reductase
MPRPDVKHGQQHATSGMKTHPVILYQRGVQDPKASSVLTLNEVQPSDYRAAMRHFPAAVHVAATDGQAGRRGLTVSAACSVSDRPATVLICLNREHAANAVFTANGCFSLNTLAIGQVDVSRAFANGALGQDERFAHGDWTTLLTGAPSLTGAAAVFDCELVETTDVATHMVLFGRVRAIHVNEDADPLLYAKRHYHALGASLD